MIYRIKSYIYLTGIQLFVLSTALVAQNSVRGVRVVELDSVRVVAKQRNAPSHTKIYSPGTNVISYNADDLKNMADASLADFIKSESAVYIKEYGRGMNASLSVRGTSSSHTAIDWNGQSMALPTLGQTDLSHIPLYFFDAMDIHIGGGAALYGDGGIGGSVRLKTVPKWVEGHSGDISVAAGSFASIFTGATYRYSSEKIESRSSIFYDRAENNYRFKNNTKPGKPTERLNNSAFSNKGLLQELFVKTGKPGVLSGSIMYMDFDREIQPSVSLNDRPESYNSIYDNNLKVSVNLEGADKNFAWSTTASFAHDLERYKEDTISASRFLFNGHLEYRNSYISMKIGAHGEHTIPQVKSYILNVKESKAGTYILSRFDYPGILYLSAGVRYLYSTSGKIPLMPLVNAKLRLPLGDGNTMYIRGGWSSNAKIPSLNDRYWGGDYLYLNSEKSQTGEVGVDWSLFRPKLSADLFITIYRSNVEDWIRWLPAGEVWRPRNIPLVFSKGLELGGKVFYKADLVTLNLKFNYAHTNIKTIKPAWPEDPAKGHQLAYQPKNSWRSSASAGFGLFEATVAVSYTGRRSTTDIYDILPSYTLTDLGIKYKMAIKENELILRLSLNNIFDVRYQNVKFYAMPGFNWSIGAQYNF